MEKAEIELNKAGWTSGAVTRGSAVIDQTRPTAFDSPDSDGVGSGGGRATAERCSNRSLVFRRTVCKQALIP